MLRTPIDRRALLTRTVFGAGVSALPPRVFAGSSIEIPTGRDLVPGLPA
ncbi:MAG TPA: hypothetical protein VN808_04760 [Stellaceae bacterium]|nr:hypothetical protein [Stellaceae bacterium]